MVNIAAKTYRTMANVVLGVVGSNSLCATMANNNAASGFQAKRAKADSRTGCGSEGSVGGSSMLPSFPQLRGLIFSFK
ncbi:hypothetical protein SDC9_167981 [bioreactor metagenome]|uniref:Uncharacterized protein n=1 Tax=bioreactor metagenome TaxID=1076179 RepID=A0A645G3T3_9ZZZZ